MDDVFEFVDPSEAGGGIRTRDLLVMRTQQHDSRIVFARSSPGPRPHATSN